jgi:hypothetical protein
MIDGGIFDSRSGGERKVANNRKKGSPTESGESATPASDSASQRDDRPIDELIRARAYELFLERRGKNGSEVDDWLQAEREYRRDQ